MKRRQHKQSELRKEIINVEFCSTTSARDWMSQICGPHELETPHPHHLRFHHQGIRLGHLTLGMLAYETDVSIKTDDLLHSYSISLPISGTQQFEHLKSCVESDAEQGLIISPGHPFRLSLDAHCRKRLVLVSREALEHKLTTLLNRDIARPVIFEPGVALNGEMGLWWQTIGSLSNMLLNPNSLVDHNTIWTAYQDILLSLLLQHQPHNYSQQLEARLLRRPDYLHELVSMMEEMLDQPLTLADLERTAGVAKKKLYHDFHHFYGCSPIAYFRELRFREVRRRLLNAQRHESVSLIALDCGFSQLGRFAKEYQQRYNELPSFTFTQAMASPGTGQTDGRCPAA